jgi:hypothetical protein
MKSSDPDDYDSDRQDSEIDRQDNIIMYCEEFLLESEVNRKDLLKQSRKYRWNSLAVEQRNSKEDMKTHHIQTDRVEQTELD